MQFQSTHPLRGATWYKFLTFLLKNFNPRTPCGVRRIYGLCVDFVTIISIHAPLAGCDHPQIGKTIPIAISIHAPLAGCDRGARLLLQPQGHFNPRTPCGVRQFGEVTAVEMVPNFNPRTPCGVRRRRSPTTSRSESISIHAPLAGCDNAEHQYSL